MSVLWVSRIMGKKYKIMKVMSSKVLALIGLCFAICFVSGCASMQTSFPVDSKPQGAEVILNGNPTGKITPCKFLVKDLDEGQQVLTVRKEGFIPETPPLEFRIGRHPVAPVVVSIALFPIGLIMASGAWANDCKVIEKRSANRPIYGRWAKPFVMNPSAQAALVPKGTGDAIHLKDGSIIRGQLLEIQPGKQYRIRRSDGSEQVFPVDTVDSIERASAGVQGKT